MLLQCRALQQIGMEEQGPSRQLDQLAVVFLSSYLSGSHTNDGSFLVVVFSATVGQVDVRLVVKEDAIHAIVVQAMAHGRHFCIVDDADQRMRVRVSHPLAIVAYIPYFQNLAHNHSFVFVGMSLHKNTLSQPIGRT